MFGLFRRRQPKVEKRSTGYTADLIAARDVYISGARGVAELTATVQACAGLWEGAMALADVEGTDLLDRRSMALLARSAALRGEAVFLIDDDGLIPAFDWHLTTRFGKPTAYRLSLPDAGGGTTRTVLAAEVLHLRVGSDPSAPYAGTAPLRRAQISAVLLNEIEGALAEVFSTAPIGSQVVPFPESPDIDMEKIARDFRGKRGRVLLRESVAVTAAGGPAPSTDWRPQDTTPDLSRIMPVQMLDEARNAILSVFGVLPGLLNPSTTGPMVREGQRHLATWTLQPIAALLAEEATAKLGSPVKIDVMRPLQAFDAGGRARAAAAVVEMLARAKETGIDPSEALRLVDWD